MGSRPENPPPQIPADFGFLRDLLANFGPQVQEALTGIFAAPQLSDAGEFSGALGGAVGGQGALGTFEEGLATGFFPDVLGQVESQLLPALERTFVRGTAAIKEGAAGLGTLDSTGTSQGITDFRGGLESNLLRELAGITGNLAQGAQGIRAGLASQGVAGILPAVQTGLAGSQAQRQVPLQALRGISGGTEAVPLFQPSFGPSKGESAAGPIASIAGPVLGGLAGGGAAGGAGKGAGAGAGAGKGAGTAAAAACWIAAAVFSGGWDDPRTHATRRFITRHPKLLALYTRYGERIAEFVKRHTWARLMLFPLFSQFARAGARR